VKLELRFCLFDSIRRCYIARRQIP